MKTEEVKQAQNGGSPGHKKAPLCQQSFTLSLPVIVLLIALAIGGTGLGIAGWVVGNAKAAMASANTGATNQPAPSPPNQTQASSGEQTMPLTSSLMPYMFTKSATAFGMQFASEVSISGDGTRAAVSDKLDNNEIGSVYIFVRDTATNVWTTETKVVPSDCKVNVVNGDTRGCSFGRSIALNHDGSVLAIGGNFDNTVVPGFGTGAAWTFTRSGTSWSQVGPKLVPAGVPNNGGVGTTIAINTDGSTILVGAPGMSSSFVFFRSTGSIVWSQQGSALRGSGESTLGGSFQGTSCAVSGDGNTAAVGGSLDNNQAGAVWIFLRNGATWSQQGSKLQSTDQTLQQQGVDVAITHDGNTIAVGTISGRVLVYRRTDQTWNFVSPMLTSKENLPQFGGKIAISGDGSTLLASQSLSQDSGQFPGCVARFQADSAGSFAFNRTACMSFSLNVVPAGVTAKAFGDAMSLTFDGQHGVIAAPFSGFSTNPFGITFGIAFVF